MHMKKNLKRRGGGEGKNRGKKKTERVPTLLLSVKL
jgi:hypothetical protein